MSISLVQNPTAEAWHASSHTTASITTTAGNAVLMRLSRVLGGVASSVLSTGVTWEGTARQVQTNGINSVEIWIGVSTGGSGGVTITLGSTGYCESSLFELSCTSGVFAFDTSVGTTGTGNPDAGSITPGGTNVFLLSSVTAANGPGGGSPDVPPTGYTLVNGQALNDQQAGAYRIVNGTSGAYSSQWTEPHNNWACCVVSIKEVAGGGGTTYTLSISGAITPAGALSKKALRTVTGAMTPGAGILARSLLRAVAGAMTPGAGILTKQGKKSLSGAMTPGAGTLTGLPTRVVGGSLTPSANLSKQGQKPLAGALAPAGYAGRLYKLSTLAGSITPGAGTVDVHLIPFGTILPFAFRNVSEH